MPPCSVAQSGIFISNYKILGLFVSVLMSELTEQSYFKFLNINETIHPPNKIRQRINSKVVRFHVKHIIQPNISLR